MQGVKSSMTRMIVGFILTKILYGLTEKNQPQDFGSSQSTQLSRTYNQEDTLTTERCCMNLPSTIRQPAHTP